METKPLYPGELRDGELKLELEDFAMHPVHHVPTYHLRMVHAESAEVMGHIRLRIGSTPHVERYAGHIGYAVEPGFRGQHYAARSVRLLAPLAAAHGIDPLWITCDPENMASRRTLEIAGAELVEVVDVPEDCIIRQSGHPRKFRYRIATGASTSRKLE
jgi:tagatose 1,6-diphosphate aldolase